MFILFEDLLVLPLISISAFGIMALLIGKKKTSLGGRTGKRMDKVLSKRAKRSLRASLEFFLEKSQICHASWSRSGQF